MSNKIVSELTEKEELALEKNIIWLFGYPYDALHQLSRQLSFFGNHLLDEPQICKGLGPLRVRLNGTKTFIEYRKDSHYFFSKMFSETWMFYLRKLIFHRIHAQFQNVHEKIIINEPEGIASSSIISKCFPNSKIIFLLQDDNAAIDIFTNECLKDSMKLLITSLSEFDRIQIHKIITNRFLKIKQIIMESFNSKKELRYIVKYEELRKNPQKELEKIFRFLEIEIDRKKIEDMVEKHNFEKNSEKTR